MNNFYIYIYLDPRKPGKYEHGNYCFLYEPFYVGKGKGNRWKEFSGRNNYFKRIINNVINSGLKPIIIKLKENLNEQQSFILENEIISLIGRRKHGSLINFTDGGEGPSGYKHTEEIKKNLRNEFKKRGYELLTKKENYQNAHQKLEYICPNGHNQSITWTNFREGHNCPCFRKYNRRIN